MITGLGFSEILVVVAIVLVFFGSKELPRFIREIASLLAKARHYSDKVRRELDDLSRPVKTPLESPDSPVVKKREIRKEMRKKRRELSPEERAEKSRRIWEHVKMLPEYRNAPAVMVYVDSGVEVETKPYIEEMLREGKRVVIPYCKVTRCDLGIAEIKIFDRDLHPGEYGILEPVMNLRDNFLKSDLRIILCPGVTFDKQGGRLGQGKHYYDTFLQELKGNAFLAGLAYQCQILDSSLPFDYHDISMDQVITENGPVIKKEEDADNKESA
ncbi:MAG: 5-formyltetrahydrofolate cyclo-ligase [Chitinivibrionales bacterium]|nr:5-formyltetrahydrofolate cyclo-ligase [Chitinivibrionales bacterium]